VDAAYSFCGRGKSCIEGFGKRNLMERSLGKPSRKWGCILKLIFKNRIIDRGMYSYG
jgi:hypothetical protein